MKFWIESPDTNLRKIYIPQNEDYRGYSNCGPNSPVIFVYTNSWIKAPPKWD